MSKTLTVSGVAIAIGLLAATSCSTETPVSPSEVAAVPAAAVQAQTADHVSHVNTKPDDKGYIDGWFDGADVQLYYTKAYYCEPLTINAPADCEIGAPAETPPRPGPIPTIYALAAVGFTPDPSTVACVRGSPCLDHPTMIDLSRIGGPAPGAPLSHSHVLDAHHAGWFNTVNIRVLSLAAWNEIAAAKTLAKVRELQGDPHTGRPGVISADTPTNIYFFIASWREDRD
jgi:hypothetical protein